MFHSDASKCLLVSAVKITCTDIRWCRTQIKSYLNWNSPICKHWKVSLQTCNRQFRKRFSLFKGIRSVCGEKTCIYFFVCGKVIAAIWPTFDREKRLRAYSAVYCNLTFGGLSVCVRASVWVRLYRCANVCTHRSGVEKWTISTMLLYVDSRFQNIILMHFANLSKIDKRITSTKIQRQEQQCWCKSNFVCVEVFHLVALVNGQKKHAY